MSGFFDRINKKPTVHFRPPAATDAEQYAKTNEDKSNIFALKPASTINAAEIWKEEVAFGENSGFGIDKRHPELEPPLINKVMSATNFVDSGNYTKNSMQPNNSGPRRQKYMPIQKTGMELFDEETQIHVGPAFKKIFDERNDCEITVTGGDGKCPIISTFEECEFCESINENISLKKYGNPTQIQKCVIPLIMHKKYDIMGYAQTGSGKTAAFLLPIIDHVEQVKKKNKEFHNSNMPYAIIVAPTKELAEQLANDARAFSERSNVRVAVSYGDMPLQENLNHIRFGCDIFVATCGRLIHFVREEIIKLDRLMYFILDEADRLLNDAFLDCIRALKQHKSMNREHRTLMFSATFDEGIQSVAKEFLRESYFFVRIGEMNRPADTVEQTFIRVQKYDKQDLLLKMLTDRAQEMRREDDTTYYQVEKTMVFVQHKRQSDRLAVALAQAGFLVISINADRTLKQRMDAAEKFTKNIYNVLVATDVAARGLNFPNVNHVINYELPEKEVSSYIHRIGRAGRAGNLGRATAFFDPQGEEVHYAGFYIQTLQSTNQAVPKFLRDIYQSQRQQEQELMQTYGKEFSGQQGSEWY